MAAAAQTFYRTRAGSHRHESWSCANTRRSLYGEVRKCNAEEAAEMPLCVFCSTGDLKAEAERVAAEADRAAAEKAAAQCANSGVKHPQRIQSTCRDCGKEGKVNRSTGSLRAHKPAPPARSIDDLF